MLASWNVNILEPRLEPGKDSSTVLCGQQGQRTLCPAGSAFDLTRKAAVSLWTEHLQAALIPLRAHPDGRGVHRTVVGADKQMSEEHGRKQGSFQSRNGVFLWREVRVSMDILGWDGAFWKSPKSSLRDSAEKPHCTLAHWALPHQACLSTVTQLLLAPLRSHYTSANWVTAWKALCLVNQAHCITYHICLVICIIFVRSLMRVHEEEAEKTMWFMKNK